MLAIGNRKVCSSCKIEKDLTAFCKHNGNADKLQNVCKVCKAQMTKNWRHSIKSGQFDKMKQDQNGQCMICKQSPDELLIDHCHRSGNIRGLLCRKCNALLGMCDDNINTLNAAISYLGGSLCQEQ